MGKKKGKAVVQGDASGRVRKPRGARYPESPWEKQVTALLRARFQAAANGVVAVGARATFDRAVAKERARERLTKTVRRMPHRLPIKVVFVVGSSFSLLLCGSFIVSFVSLFGVKNEES